jgi:hypothetical protein
MLPVTVADDDGPQARTLDQCRLGAVQGDAYHERTRAVQQLARERDGTCELGVLVELGHALSRRACVKRYSGAAIQSASP